MFEVKVRAHFDAAHFLRGYGGRCEELHGHRFEVEIGLKVGGLNEIGISYDFRELKEKLAKVLTRFDHICLNELPEFREENPSSENIARLIYKELKPRLEGVELSYVEVWESPQSGVRFSP